MRSRNGSENRRFAKFARSKENFCDSWKRGMLTSSRTPAAGVQVRQRRKGR